MARGSSKPHVYRWALALLLVVVATVSATPSANADNKFIRSFESMGTTVHLTVWTQDRFRAALATSLVILEFDQVNRAMSSWLPESGVSRINAAAGAAPVTVAPEVFELISRAQSIADKTGGAFDITVGAFRGLWKFDHDRDGSVPSADDVAERLELVDYRNVELTPQTRSVRLKRPGMRITLGGVAKGYAVDRAVKRLRSLGIDNFIVQAGGDLYASGSKAGKAWMVGVRDPRGTADNPFALTPIENQTFSTSGDYERYVIRDGVRYHHLLDPKTGHPATSSRSVTVKADDATTADMWSTALFVLGPDRGMNLVEHTDGIEAVFVDAKNRVHVSAGLRGSLRQLHPPTPGL